MVKIYCEIAKRLEKLAKNFYVKNSLYFALKNKNNTKQVFCVVVLYSRFRKFLYKNKEKNCSI
jgi:hypothetical protein